MFAVNRALVCSLLLIASAVSNAHGQETKIIELPDSYGDFAMNPETGDVLATLPKNDSVVLIRAGFLNGDGMGVKEPVKVGPTPVCVNFKKYKDKSYFVVICSQDSNAFVLDAVDGNLVKKIPIQQSGATWGACSRNPEDPFFYYSFGGGHDSQTGAIDLRSMRDAGVAFDDSMDCAISSSGKIAYRRGPWSPSGFESLQLTSDFSATQPQFVQLFYDHNSTAQYLPDPFENYTAAGRALYRADLKKKVATMDGQAVCFFQSKPIIVCNTVADRFGRHGSSEIKLSCVSYNTFNKVGSLVTVNLGDGTASALPRGAGGGQADFKQVTTRRRYFADDKRQRLVIMESNEAAIVKLSQFELPDEAFLQASISNNELTVGKKNFIKITLKDPRTELEFEDLPDGVKQVDGGLDWSPTGEQVGFDKIIMNLKHGSVEKQQVALVNVVFPSAKLPFPTSRFAVSTSGDFAVAWEEDSVDRHRSARAQTVVNQNRIALVDLNENLTLLSRKMPFRVRTAAVDEHFVYVSSAEVNYLHVLSKKDLKKVKTVYGDVAIDSIVTDGATVRIAGQEYHLPELKRKRNSESGTNIQLVIQQLPDINQENQIRNLTRIGQQLEARKNPTGRQNPRNSRVNSPVQSLDSIDVHVQAYASAKTLQVPGATHTSEHHTEAGLTIYSKVGNRQLAKQKLYVSRGPQKFGSPSSRSGATACRVEAVGDRAFLLYNDRIFQWTPADTELEDVVEVFQIEMPKPVFVTGDGRQTIQLKASGGKGPYEFVMLSSTPGLSLSDSGQVTIDTKQLINSAQEAFGKQANGGAGIHQQEQVISRMDDHRKQIESLLGKPFEGWPMRFDVRIRGVDSESQSANTLVTIVFPLDRNQAIKELADAKKLFEEKRIAKEKAMNARKQPSNKSDNDEVAKLRKKVEVLEARVDLLTRQLSELLKEQKPIK